MPTEPLERASMTTGLVTRIATWPPRMLTSPTVVVARETTSELAPVSSRKVCVLVEEASTSARDPSTGNVATVVSASVVLDRESVRTDSAPTVSLGTQVLAPAHTDLTEPPIAPTFATGARFSGTSVRAASADGGAVLVTLSTGAGIGCRSSSACEVGRLGGRAAAGGPGAGDLARAVTDLGVGQRPPEGVDAQVQDVGGGAGGVGRRKWRSRGRRLGEAEHRSRQDDGQGDRRGGGEPARTAGARCAGSSVVPPY